MILFRDDKYTELSFHCQEKSEKLSGETAHFEIKQKTNVFVYATPFECIPDEYGIELNLSCLWPRFC